MKILIVSFTDLDRDPRVIRQLAALEEIASVDTVSIGKPLNTKGTHFEVDERNGRLIDRLVFIILLALRLDVKYLRYRFQYTYLIDKLRGNQYDVIIANEPTAIDLAQQLTSKSRIIFDAHELYTVCRQESIKHRYFLHPATVRLLEQSIQGAGYFISVSKGLLEVYRQMGVAKDRSLVVNNASKYHDRVPGQVSEVIKVVYHGNCAPRKNIEALIEGVGGLQGFELHLLLLKNSPTRLAHFKTLQQLARPFRNVFFHDAVPFDQIVSTIASYDLGVYLLPATNMHNQIALPNKVFEYIQARLGVIVGPADEMKRLVDSTGVGRVLEGWESSDLRECLGSLDRQDVYEFKQLSDKSAPTYSAEHGMETLLRLVQSIA